MELDACTVGALLLASALALNSTHHPRHVAAKPAPETEVRLPETVYGNVPEAAAPEAAGVVTVRGGERAPAAPGAPLTIYGDQEPQRVFEIAAAAAAPAADTNLPITVTAEEAETPAKGMPQTVYAGDWRPGPVHEAQLAAEQEFGDDTQGMAAQPDIAPDEGMAGEEDTAGEPAPEAGAEVAPAGSCALPPQNGLPLFRNWPGLPMETASPYSPYTDAQRAGMNPCEDKQPAPSPYGPMTDAQRAAQTNCR